LDLYSYLSKYTQTQTDQGKYIFTVTSEPSIIFTNNVFEAMGFNANSTNTFSGGSLTASTNVIKLQAEDTIYIHSDLVTNGTDNILQEIFTNGDINYSSVNFQNTSVDAYAKLITTNQNNVYNFFT